MKTTLSTLKTERGLYVSMASIVSMLLEAAYELDRAGKRDIAEAFAELAHDLRGGTRA